MTGIERVDIQLAFAHLASVATRDTRPRVDTVGGSTHG